MGHNTAVLIINDALHELQTDPKAGEKLARAVVSTSCHSTADVPLGNHCNAATVLSSRHADASQLVLVGGNSIRRVLDVWESNPSDEAVLRALAEQLGFKLVKRVKSRD